MFTSATITSFTLQTRKYKYLKNKLHFPNANVKWNNKTSSIENKKAKTQLDTYKNIIVDNHIGTKKDSKMLFKDSKMPFEDLETTNDRTF
jgi:hypothetical protein